MQGFVIHPEYARMRVPGLVPRLDPAIDLVFAMPAPRAPDAVFDESPRPILRPSDIPAGLGLPGPVERSVTDLVRGLGGANELDFRRGVMTHLLERAVEPALRRAVLARALDYFRRGAGTPATSVTPGTSVTPLDQRARTDGPALLLERARARGGRYHRRVPRAGGGYTYVYDPDAYAARADAHVDGDAARTEYLKTAVKKLLDKNADGCPVDAFRDLVLRHGKEAVGAAIRAHSPRLEGEKLFLAKSSADTSYSPPEGVRRAARRGLELRRKHGRGGIDNAEASRQGIGSGVQRASDLASGDRVSLDTVRRMHAFFSRHEKNRGSMTGHEDGGPTAGHIAWLLWGGDAGRSWARGIVESADAVSKAGAVGPAPAAGAVPAAGGVSPKKLAVGTRRIWHNRIVERLPDDKWHVVGHVAGLEDQKKVPPLEADALTPDEVEDLVQKIRALVDRARKQHRSKK